MEHGQGPAWIQALEASAPAAAVRDSLFLYPLANTAHVLGLALLFGAIVALDLRLLGVGRTIPVAPLSRLLTGLAVFGFLIAAPAGIALFMADASAMAGNIVFLMKLTLVVAALLNALLFRWLWSDEMQDWDFLPPVGGRLQAVLSLLLWCGAATSGRLIAYF